MENVEVKKSSKKPEKVKNPKDKKKIACIATFVVGLFVLVVGAVFLVLNLMRGNSVADGEYLVSADKWALEIDSNDASSECEEGEECETVDQSGKVVWDFTEIGKGTLTTDGGEHNYDFEWAIEDGKLIIQTAWLDELHNEYEYSLDQGNGVLTLKDGDGEYKFTAQ